MKIGNVTPDKKIFLAPMAGVTDKTFRRICREHGAGLVCSEMVSAKGLHYNDKKTAALMDITGESPCAIQLFGSEPDIIAEAVEKAMAFGPDIIDINMGCPAPKIVGSGDGSALMKDPPLIGRIVRAAVGAAAVPVTVKLRKGWDADNALDCARIAEENGAAAVTIHGRTRAEFYGGRADWDVIRRVKAELKIPVIGNGDIFTAQDALDMLDYTGCDAVMAARGAQGNPWLFTQADELLTLGETRTYPTPKERLEAALDHAERLVEAKGETRGVKEARKHIAWYVKGMRGAAAIKSEIFKISDFAVLRAALIGYIDKIS